MSDYADLAPGDLAQLVDAALARWIPEAAANRDVAQRMRLFEACESAALVSVLLGQRQEQIDATARLLTSPVTRGISPPGAGATSPAPDGGPRRHP
ncbi:hypothetical protein [Nocardia cyriacigeorgica]|uniref:hypothetical protein n=1 Tax=Nocardia cyriacigeorgica TaxID=135487 RepID=UPI0024588C37|nr:hypothetical protein [Nocardia cyriacigeorgica]